ncbi:MAG: ribosome silencing factor [Deltaproteobacteria bacterium RIFCSPLOWO2_02_FULL_44_10]|nr:MAG: ribosome silencing factor [Deltaproteobacteria bacterium RIFCSPHIGHO2_02_FULL_44_16]OGQ46709.1 MAG: ribosome silencing factor [Deltaproteobacteria bacterium RIFCSPLOWO2_02_FULL_44_10]
MRGERLAKKIALIANEKKAHDILVLDLRGLTSFTDYFVICSGMSDRQVEAIVNAISTELKERGCPPLGKEGEESGHWVLVDYGDVVAHVFHYEEREFYHLERLWVDAKRVEVEEISAIEKAS